MLKSSDYRRTVEARNVQTYDKNYSSNSIIKNRLERDEELYIINGQGPNCIVISTSLDTQTKNKLLFIKKMIHFQTNLHDSKSTDNGVKIKAIYLRHSDYVMGSK